jgi:hypothetical protein
LLLALLSPSCNLLHHQELARASSGAQEEFNPSSFSKKKKIGFFCFWFSWNLKQQHKTPTTTTADSNKTSQ